MSQWNINDIKLYGQLVTTISLVSNQLPTVMREGKDCLDQLYRDIQVDLKESIDQLQNLSEEDHEEKSRLKQKIESLKGLLSHVNMMHSSFRTLETKNADFTKMGEKAESILTEFTQIGSVYLNLRTNGSNDSGNTSRNPNVSLNKEIRLLGDTFHFSKQNNLSQMTIDSLERDIKNSHQKGHKISIDKVSQSDFSLLEKNGYTVQEIKANEYSAYKTI
jgi:hypothetical protein